MFFLSLSLSGNPLNQNDGVEIMKNKLLRAEILILANGCDLGTLEDEIAERFLNKSIDTLKNLTYSFLLNDKQKRQPKNSILMLGPKSQIRDKFLQNCLGLNILENTIQDFEFCFRKGSVYRSNLKGLKLHKFDESITLNYGVRTMATIFAEEKFRPLVLSKLSANRSAYDELAQAVDGVGCSSAPDLDICGGSVASSTSIKSVFFGMLALNRGKKDRFTDENSEDLGSPESQPRYSPQGVDVAKSSGQANAYSLGVTSEGLPKGRKKLTERSFGNFSLAGKVSNGSGSRVKKQKDLGNHLKNSSLLGDMKVPKYESKGKFMDYHLPRDAGSKLSQLSKFKISMKIRRNSSQKEKAKSMVQSFTKGGQTPEERKKNESIVGAINHLYHHFVLLRDASKSNKSSTKLLKKVNEDLDSMWASILSGRLHSFSDIHSVTLADTSSGLSSIYQLLPSRNTACLFLSVADVSKDSVFSWVRNATCRTSTVFIVLLAAEGDEGANEARRRLSLNLREYKQTRKQYVHYYTGLEGEPFLYLRVPQEESSKLMFLQELRSFLLNPKETCQWEFRLHWFSWYESLMREKAETGTDSWSLTNALELFLRETDKGTKEELGVCLRSFEKTFNNLYCSLWTDSTSSPFILNRQKWLQVLNFILGASEEQGFTVITKDLFKKFMEEIEWSKINIVSIFKRSLLATDTRLQGGIILFPRTQVPNENFDSMNELSEPYVLRARLTEGSGYISFDTCSLLVNSCLCGLLHMVEGLSMSNTGCYKPFVTAYSAGLTKEDALWIAFQAKLDEGRFDITFSNSWTFEKYANFCLSLFSRAVKDILACNIERIFDFSTMSSRNHIPHTIKVVRAHSIDGLKLSQKKIGIYNLHEKSAWLKFTKILSR
eukprot:augustus_masked-scaffold_14-processed-gene-3.15-mRNA-1 protein AED:1.00 eAED:1.00 QI:0/-1/0/0/-1/1/1/0/886